MVGMGICVRGGVGGAQLRDRRLDRFVGVLVPFVGEDLCRGGGVDLGGCRRAGWDEVVGIIRGCNDEAGGLRWWSLREGRGGGSLMEGLVVARLAREIGRCGGLHVLGGCSRATASWRRRDLVRGERVEMDRRRCSHCVSVTRQRPC